MNWQPISELTDDLMHSGATFLIHHSDYVDADFNPEGVIEGVPYNDNYNETSWIGSAWDNYQDRFYSEEVVKPTHFCIIKGPDYAR